MKARVTTRQVEEGLRSLVAKDLRAAYLEIGRAVRRAARNGSALNGLEIIAAAFSMVLDTYANPNAENPQGMCDDPKAFRKYFADIVAHSPHLKGGVQ